MLRCFCFTLLLTVLATGAGLAQTETPFRYTPKVELGAFAEYSNDSSHILLGQAEGRKLLNFGGEWAQRLYANDHVAVSYLAQVHPVILESDLAEHQYGNIHDMPFDFTGRVDSAKGCPFSISQPPSSLTCKVVHQWTYAAGLSPFGYKVNLATRHRLQPVLSGTFGMLYAKRQVPIDRASQFNFTFEVGGGLEYFRSARRAVRLDYRYHHISNAYTGQENPGVDSGLFQVTYAFGR